MHLDRMSRVYLSSSLFSATHARLPRFYLTGHLTVNFQVVVLIVRSVLDIVIRVARLASGFTVFSTISSVVLLTCLLRTKDFL